MQRVHFQVWVGVFSCKQILTEISFVIFDIVVKKQLECRLAWHWRNSTDLGLCIYWHVFLPIRLQKLFLVSYYSAKSRCKPYLETTSKYDFFPWFGGRKWQRFEHAHASYPELFFSPARVKPLYEAGRKESSGTGLSHARLENKILALQKLPFWPKKSKKTFRWYKVSLPTALPIRKKRMKCGKKSPIS